LEASKAALEQALLANSWQGAAAWETAQGPTW